MFPFIIFFVIIASAYVAYDIMFTTILTIPGLISAKAPIRIHLFVIIS